MTCLKPLKLIFIFIASFTLFVFLTRHDSRITLDASQKLDETSALNTSDMSFKYENYGRCQGAERNHCIPPLHEFEKRFRVTTKYKINVCAIEKNLSTIMTAVLCFLFNEEKFAESSRDINSEAFHRRFCRTKNEATSINHLERKFKINATDWLHLAIVREPIERFVSGFVDKCIIEKRWEEHPKECNSCRQNVTCFVEREYKRMFLHSKGAKLNNFDDRHFFPQSWRCDFSAHFRRFTLLQYTNQNTESFLQLLYTHFQSRNVSNSTIAFIDKQLHSGKTKHATVGRIERELLERQVRSNPYILQYIIWMYYYDFVLFGFPLPETMMFPLDMPALHLFLYILVIKVMLLQVINTLFYISRLPRLSQNLLCIFIFCVVFGVIMSCPPPNENSLRSFSEEDQIRIKFNYFAFNVLVFVFMMMLIYNFIEVSNLPIHIQLYITQVVIFIVIGAMYYRPEIPKYVHYFFGTVCYPR